MTREDLEDIVFQAVASYGGSATLIEVARYVWNKHEADLRKSGNLFFTWQYDVRWAAQQLRNAGKFKDSKTVVRGRWEIK